jgi:hypothetical protein
MFTNSCGATESGGGYGLMHGTLAAASFCPSFCGSAFSAIDGVIYAAQGDKISAGISFGAATVGMVTDAGAAKLFAMGVKDALVTTKEAAVAAKEVELTAAQLKNVDRFAGKLPANAKDSVSLKALPNDGVAAQAVSPGRVPGSSAVYEKQIDATGKTIQYTKTTYDPAGNIVHVKDKISGGVFP